MLRFPPKMILVPLDLSELSFQAFTFRGSTLERVLRASQAPVLAVPTLKPGIPEALRNLDISRA